jgi:agmatinase
VEPFDEEHWGEPYRSIGLATLDLKSIHTDVDGALDVLEDIIATLLKAEKFPLVLGGEHSVTAGAVRAYVEKYPNLSILHFGAAAHLKDGDMGQFNSHASSLRRCLDNPDVRLVSCGVRNLSAEEAGYLSQNPERIRIYWAKNQEEWDMEEIAAGLKGRQVYISFDVGAFDPSFMPASGTPEPGGLRWVDAMGIIRAASRLASIVGADIVGLTPIENLYAPDFIAAKLAYKILGYAFSNNY